MIFTRELHVLTQWYDQQFTHFKLTLKLFILFQILEIKIV